MAAQTIIVRPEKLEVRGLVKLREVGGEDMLSYLSQGG